MIPTRGRRRSPLTRIHRLDRPRAERRLRDVAHGRWRDGLQRVAGNQARAAGGVDLQAASRGLQVEDRLRLASADVDEHRLIIVDGRAEKIIRGASTACRQSDRRRGGPTEPKPVLEVADRPPVAAPGLGKRLQPTLGWAVRRERPQDIDFRIESVVRDRDNLESRSHERPSAADVDFRCSKAQRAVCWTKNRPVKARHQGGAAQGSRMKTKRRRLNASRWSEVERIERRRKGAVELAMDLLDRVRLVRQQYRVADLDPVDGTDLCRGPWRCKAGNERIVRPAIDVGLTIAQPDQEPLLLVEHEGHEASARRAIEVGRRDVAKAGADECRAGRADQGIAEMFCAQVEDVRIATRLETRIKLAGSERDLSATKLGQDVTPRTKLLARWCQRPPACPADCSGSAPWRARSCTDRTRPWPCSRPPSMPSPCGW